MSYGELSNTQETMVLPMLQMKNIRGKPYITVSAKGMINGLSNIPNDGADFGPDTTLGATAPTQTGSPYTETYGIQEAVSYATATNLNYVKLNPGTYTWQPVPTSQYVTLQSVAIEGSGIDETIITLANSTDHFDIPFYVNSNVRISGITFNMQSNNNTSYTPSAIWLLNPSQYIEIDHCKFINQAVADFIQCEATFNSTSPPTGYIEKVRIHNNIFNANIPSGMVADECIAINNSKYVDIFNNTFIFDGTGSMTNGFFSIYDYSRHTHIYGNRFIITGASPHNPFMNLSDTYDAYFENNVIEANVTNTNASIIGVQNVSKYVYIKNNMAIGILAPGYYSFLAFILFGLSADAVQNGSGGPDGNVSQNAGWNDYIVISNNYIIGLYALIAFAFTGNQNFNYLEISNNITGTLRLIGNPFAYANQNNGTFIFENNYEIGDILIGYTQIGGGEAWFNPAPPSGYTLAQLIIRNNNI